LEKKLFKGTVITDSGQQIEYFRWAANERQASCLIRKAHNQEYGREPWAFVNLVVEEVAEQN
jgi:hypothetical protein